MTLSCAARLFRASGVPSMVARVGRGGAPRTRGAVGALLAIIALCCLISLVTWHDARPHVHHAAAIEQLIDHDDHQPGDQQPSDPMHLVAHALLSGMAIPQTPAVTGPILVIALRWPVHGSRATGSFLPTSILRPPRR